MATYFSQSAVVPYQIHGGFLGGFVEGSTGAFSSLPVQGVAPVGGGTAPSAADVAAGAALRTGFSTASGSIIAALNYLDANSLSLTAGDGIDSTLLSSNTVAVSASQVSGGIAFSDSAIFFSPASITAATVDVANDDIIIGQSSALEGKKESIADLMTAVAGDGLAASSGVLSVNLSSTGSIHSNNDLLFVSSSATGGIAQNNNLLFVEAGNGITTDANGVKAKAKTSGGITVDSDGISVNTAQALDWSANQRFGINNLQISGSNSLGAPAYFAFSVSGGILVLSEQ